MEFFNLSNISFSTIKLIAPHTLKKMSKYYFYEVVLTIGCIILGSMWVDKNTADSSFQQYLKIFGQRLMCVVGLLLLLPLPWQLITYQLGRLLGSTTKFTIYSKLRKYYPLFSFQIWHLVLVWYSIQESEVASICWKQIFVYVGKNYL